MVIHIIKGYTSLPVNEISAIPIMLGYSISDAQEMLEFINCSVKFTITNWDV